MDPATGTFTTMDTYSGRISDPASLHKYLFANSNPVMYCDPSRSSATIEDLLVGCCFSRIIGGTLAAIDYFVVDIFIGRQEFNLGDLFETINTGSSIGLLAFLGFCLVGWMLGTAVAIETAFCLGVCSGTNDISQGLQEISEGKVGKGVYHCTAGMAQIVGAAWMRERATGGPKDPGDGGPQDPPAPGPKDPAPGPQDPAPSPQNPPAPGTGPVGGYGGGETKFSPVNPGPLDIKDANSFRSGTYTRKILTEETTFYRVYSSESNRIGPYMTRTPQNGGMQSQIDLALNPDWGNNALYVEKVVVPKGTTIYEGVAAPQTINGGAGSLIGGGNQVFIDRKDLDVSWFKH